MSYHSFFYFVTQGAGSEGSTDPYAREHHCLPNRTHGIRYASSPRRSLCIRSYAPSGSVRPVCPADETDQGSPSLDGVNPKHIVIAILIMIAIALISAVGGVMTANAISGLIDNAIAPESAYGEDNATRAENLSDAASTWQVGSAPLLFQQDPAWADRPYGAGTIGSCGAAPMCLAMALIDVTGNASASPVEVASLSQRSGWADSPDATPLLTDGATQLGLAASSIEANEASIRQAIISGKPIIASVKAGSFGSGASYIVLWDIDERGKLVVNDPLSRERSTRHWTFDEITSQTDALWAYAPAQ